MESLDFSSKSYDDNFVNDNQESSVTPDNVIELYPERLKKLGKASIEISDDDETIILGYD